MKVREAIRLIEKDGWYLARQKGSHMQFKHPIKKGLLRELLQVFYGRHKLINQK